MINKKIHFYLVRSPWKYQNSFRVLLSLTVPNLIAQRPILTSIFAYIAVHHIRSFIARRATDKGKFFTINDRKIFYSLKEPVNTSKETPRVVFVSGMGASSVYWKPMQRLLLEQGIPSLYFDRCGSGFSSDQRKPTFKSYSDELSDVIENCLPKECPIVLVGHSFGGVTVQYYVQTPQVSDRISSIILVEPTPCKDFICNFPELYDSFVVKNASYINYSVSFLADIGLIPLVNDIWVLIYSINNFVRPKKFGMNPYEMQRFAEYFSDGYNIRRTSIEVAQMIAMEEEGMEMELNWKDVPGIEDRIVITGSGFSPLLDMEKATKFWSNTGARINATSFLVDKNENHDSLVYSKILFESILKSINK
jgi:pimeloyl-ACP methyl ester carboxylesterase